MNSVKKIILNLFIKFRTLILYGIIGSFSAGMDFLSFYLLTSVLDLYYLLANVFSVSIGITISFVLNRNFNFKVKDKTIKRFLIFVSVGIGGMALSSGLLFLFIDILIFEEIFSKFISIVFVVLIQFVINKFVTFKKESV